MTFRGSFWSAKIGNLGTENLVYIVHFERERIDRKEKQKENEEREKWKRERNLEDFRSLKTKATRIPREFLR